MAAVLLLKIILRKWGNVGHISIWQAMQPGTQITTLQSSASVYTIANFASGGPVYTDTNFANYLLGSDPKTPHQIYNLSHAQGLKTRYKNKSKMRL